MISVIRFDLLKCMVIVNISSIKKSILYIKKYKENVTAQPPWSSRYSSIVLPTKEFQLVINSSGK